MQLAQKNVASNAWDPISEEVVLDALEIILQKTHYPLMVMCSQGKHRSGMRIVCFHLGIGTVIGCLRKLQGWNLTSIFEEYRRYSGESDSRSNLVYRTKGESVE